MARPLRIALMGAHGTGKTTLARALVQRLSQEGIRAVQLQEAPREVCARAGDSEFFRRGQNTPLRQGLIFLMHLMQEFNAQFEGADIVVADRSLLDHWAYTLQMFENPWVNDGVKDLYESLIVDHCRKYDVIFFLPIEFAVLDDGTREGDKVFQAEIQNVMLSLIREHKLGVVSVQGSVEERVESCFKQFQSKLEELEKGGRHVGA